MKKLLAACLTLFACGPVDEPDIITSHGTRFFFQGTGTYRLDQIEKQDEWFLEFMPGYGYRKAGLIGAMGSALVRVVDEAFPCQGSASGLCNGITQGNILTVVHRTCPYWSSYSHEMVHWADWYMYGIVDMKHEAPVWEKVKISKYDCNESE